MTCENADHFEQMAADTNPGMRSKLDQLSDAALRRVAICVAAGMVVQCVVLAATNVGAEQHSWWGWLLIGAPLTWLSFLGLVVLTSGALRAVIGALRWSLSLTSRNSGTGSVAASRQTGSKTHHLDVPMDGLASIA
ncbi:MAG: hypothetical protein J2P17_03240 [Mycobacterium sp.]|nr:hypothetical protein [Mycobacterium sp.]